MQVCICSLCFLEVEKAGELACLALWEAECESKVVICSVITGPGLTFVSVFIVSKDVSNLSGRN